MNAGNGIAEQLGIPTPYVVRHAAFLYQTQLKGIHQQLRKGTRTITKSSVVNKPRPCKDEEYDTLFY